MIKKIILTLLLCQFTYSQQVLDLKDRAILIEKIQKDRLDNLLPELMSKNEIDMWIIITENIMRILLSKLYCHLHGLTLEEEQF